jgi:nicotinamidase-related amidase
MNTDLTHSPSTVTRRSALAGLGAAGAGLAFARRPAAAQEEAPSPSGVTGAGPAPSLLSPDNSALLLVDQQPAVALLITSIDLQLLVNNVTAIAKAAKVFGVPTVLSTVGAAVNRDPLLTEVQAVFPEQEPIDRSGLNAWEDPAFVAAVEATGRRKLIVAGLYTEMCLAYASLSAQAAGYEVYALVDASGGLSQIAHDAAIQCMIQAGIVPVTWGAVMLEWQRDWLRQETVAGLGAVAAEHAGPYVLQAQIAAAQDDGS